MNTNYFFLILILSLSMLSCNNPIENIDDNFRDSDTVPSVVIYDNKAITFIKEGNPTVFEIESFEISYFLKNKGDYSTKYTRNEIIEVGWTIKNIKDKTDSIYVSTRCIGSCWDINKYIYVGMSQIPKENSGITGIKETIIGGIDKIVLKSQESFSYSYSYSTTLLDSEVNDFYYEPLNYSIGDIMSAKYSIEEVLPNGQLTDDVLGIWELQPTYSLRHENDLVFVGGVTRYFIRPNFKINFTVL